MFIRHQQHPDIEFDTSAGRQEPALVHYFSDRAGPFKTVLPVLVAGTGQDEEQVLVVASPLSEIMDWAIEVRRHPDFPDQVLVDPKDHAFFTAARAALTQAIAKIDQIEYASLDDDDDNC